jgi:putative membrane protein
MNEADGAPRHLHVITVILSFARRAPSTVVIPPLALGFAGRDFHPMAALYTFAAIATAMIVVTFLGWWSFTYRISEEEVLIQHGVLRRSRRSIPRSRIQDVSIERSPFARIFGLAVVKIETGGGETEEARLESVSMAEAERLRALLRNRPQSIPGIAATPEPNRRIVFAMSLGRVLLRGLFGFSLIWIAAIFGVLHSIERVVELDWERLVGEAERVAVARFSVSLLLLALAGALLLGVIAGVVRTLLRDYGFTLFHERGRFRRVRGLLTRSEVVIAEQRIQLGLVRRGAISGRFGWNIVEVQTLGGSTDPSGRQAFAPLATTDEVAQVLAATPLPAFERDTMRPVAKAHILRSAIRHTLPLLLIFALAGWYLPVLWWGTLLAAVPVFVALFQRRRHRFAMCDTSLQVTRGVLSQRDWIVPFDSIQTLTVRQTWLQRRLGVATVQVDTAGASGWHYPDVSDAPLADAVTLARALAAQVD